MPHLLNTYNVHAHTQFYLLCQEEKERKNVNSVGASVPRPARAHALGGCKKEDSNPMCLPLVSVPELLSWYEHLTILVWFKCLKLHIFFLVQHGPEKQANYFIRYLTEKTAICSNLEEKPAELDGITASNVMHKNGLKHCTLEINVGFFFPLQSISDFIWCFVLP